MPFHTLYNVDLEHNLRKKNCIKAVNRVLSRKNWNSSKYLGPVEGEGKNSEIKHDLFDPLVLLLLNYSICNVVSRNTNWRIRSI